MTKITASDVAKLRRQTGAGMMDCKKALVESHGDFEMAVDVLRKKGQKVAAKRADRDASEGVVIAKNNSDNTKAILISLNCETDFVAKNDDFVNFVKELSDLNNNADSNIENLKKLKMTSGETVEDSLSALIRVFTTTRFQFERRWCNIVKT